MTNATTIGARIRYLRKLRGLSQRDLAKLVGISQPSISDLEGDVSKEPSAQTLLRMAAVMDANPSWIMDGTGDPLQVEFSEDQAANEMVALMGQMTSDTKAALLAAARVMAKK